MFYENGQIVRDGGGGMATTEFLVAIIPNLFFKGFQKRHKVTEVSNCQLGDTNG